MNKKKVVLVLFPTLLILISSFFFVYLKHKKCIGLNCLVFNNSSSFSLSDTYEDTLGSFRAIYKQGSDVFFRVEIHSSIEKSDSVKLLSSKISHLNDIFENSISPYPGEISVKTSCADKFKPRLTNSDRLPYFIGFLNSRLQFGSCSEDQVKNQGAIGFLYCPNQKKFYQLEYIVPVQKNEDKSPQIKQMIESINCKN